MDLNVLREELRAQAQKEQDHLALHLFAENDALREMLVEMMESKEADGKAKPEAV